MTEEQIQKKLNQLVKIANELHEEAIKIHGTDGGLYYEAGGRFVILDDADNPRSDNVTFASHIRCKMDCGGF